MSQGNEIPDWLVGAVGYLPEVTDRDRAGLVLERLDYEQQLIAIRGLLHRNEEADKRIAAEMRKLDDFARRSRGQSNERAINEWGMYFQLSVYQDAAHSMAALGMIAPLFESLFSQAFQGIRERYYGKEKIPTVGSRVGIVEPGAYWDCHNYFDRREAKTKSNFVAGVQQLSKAVGLTPHLPNDLAKMLEALFEYRNQMFHNGFEWPQEHCEKFATRIANCGWGDWFSASTRGEQPWIFCMTATFIEHCLSMLRKVLDALGAYCNSKGLTGGTTTIREVDR